LKRIRILIGILVLLSALAFMFRGRLIPTQDSDITAYFARHGQEATIRYDTLDGRAIHWVDVNPSAIDTAPVVIFVHGGAGQIAHFLHFMSDTLLNRNVRMLAFDRIGYAPFDLHISEPDIEVQGRVIGQILGHYRYPWAIVVAHSFGGAIALSHVAEHPGDIKAVFLLSPAIDPDREPVFRSVAVTQWPATRWAIPNRLVTAADEHLAHPAELLKLRPRLDAMPPVPIVHLHARWDFIIPYGNVEYSREVFPDSMLRVITISRGDHFVPWTAKGRITTTLDSLIRMP
jgi:pimeloyl-ACP methyl ester carboxylesterase